MRDNLFDSEKDSNHTFPCIDFCGIQGLTYQNSFLTPIEQTELLKDIDSQPWLSDLKRRVQHYGYKYDYTAKRIDHSMRIGPLPDWAKQITEKLLTNNLIQEEPDQAIVNEYIPGQGINAHVDCVPCFLEPIVTISLGWAIPMQFSEIKTSKQHAILLAKGSVLIMRGEARFKWRHGIEARVSDNGIKRKRRVSLTFRQVKLN